jgi:SAM-dependent methyltransferase
MSAPNTISPLAQSGFSAAETYDRHRPSYSPAIVTSLLNHLNVLGQKSARIVDLAAGTGKFTQCIVGREEGYEVVAVEPHEGMRAELEKKAFGGVKVQDGSAEAMGIEEGWADAVVAAQVYPTLFSYHIDPYVKRDFEILRC